MSVGIDTPVVTEAEVGRRMGDADPGIQFVYACRDGELMMFRDFPTKRDMEVYGHVFEIELALSNENPAPSTLTSRSGHFMTAVPKASWRIFPLSRYLTGPKIPPDDPERASLQVRAERTLRTH